MPRPDDHPHPGGGRVGTGTGEKRWVGRVDQRLPDRRGRWRVPYVRPSPRVVTSRPWESHLSLWALHTRHGVRRVTERARLQS